MTGRGLYIGIDGRDGIGKTTQVTQIAVKLMVMGYPVLTTFHPGAAKPVIRELLLNENHNITDLTELLLFIADASETWDSIVSPALEQNKIVIADRGIFSTYVYQGKYKQWDIGFITKLYQLISTNRYKPDKTFILYGDTEIKSPKDKYDKLPADFHTQIDYHYQDIANISPECLLIDGNLPIEDVTEEIMKHIIPYLNERGIEKII